MSEVRGDGYPTNEVKIQMNCGKPSVETVLAQFLNYILIVLFWFGVVLVSLKLSMWGPGTKMEWRATRNKEGQKSLECWYDDASKARQDGAVRLHSGQPGFGYREAAPGSQLCRSTKYCRLSSHLLCWTLFWASFIKLRKHILLINFSSCV